jgi:hypothetical protein
LTDDKRKALLLLQASVTHRFRISTPHVNGARATTVACIKHANFLHISRPTSGRMQPCHGPLFMRDEVISTAVKRCLKCQIQ